jgi:acylphosphatase
MSDTVRSRVVVHGRVQGVFFRDSTRRRASQLGVTGWVCNRSDGTVEAVFEGSAGAVSSMVDWARQGPRGADVERVDERSESPEGLTGFDVR